MNMNKRNLKRKLLLLIAVGSLCTPASVMAADAEIEVQSNEVSPRVDYIEWVYKVIDGQLYMRLYNYKTGEYIGEWILVK